MQRVDLNNASLCQALLCIMRQHVESVMVARVGLMVIRRLMESDMENVNHFGSAGAVALVLELRHCHDADHDVAVWTLAAIVLLCHGKKGRWTEFLRLRGIRTVVDTLLLGNRQIDGLAFFILGVDFVNDNEADKQELIDAGVCEAVVVVIQRQDEGDLSLTTDGLDILAFLSFGNPVIQDKLGDLNVCEMLFELMSKHISSDDDTFIDAALNAVAVMCDDHDVNQARCALLGMENLIRTSFPDHEQAKWALEALVGTRLYPRDPRDRLRICIVVGSLCNTVTHYHVLLND